MKKVRANKISIETPKEGAEPWIRVEVQFVEKTDTVYNVTDRYDSFNRRLSDVMDEAVPIITAIDGSTITVGDIGVHLTLVISTWLAKRYNATIDPATGDVIIEA